MTKGMPDAVEPALRSASQYSSSAGGVRGWCCCGGEVAREVGAVKGEWFSSVVVHERAPEA
eukprot:3848893-Rhodomonas_salina.1